MRSDKILVKCAICGKEELVSPSRAKHYKCCSRECLYAYRRIESEKKNHKCVCPICGTIFYLDDYKFYRAKNHCCSRKCKDELSKQTFKGENNHQYGLRGNRNPTFKNKDIFKRNNNVVDVMRYVGEWYIRPNTHGRIPLHRYEVEKNHYLYDKGLFDNIDNWFYLKEGLEVHHMDGNHSNNRIENLIILSSSEHRRFHANMQRQPRDIETGKFIKK